MSNSHTSRRVWQVLGLGWLGLGLAGPAWAEPNYSQPHLFTNLAGKTNIESTDGPADLARFNRPSGVALDTQGNLYVADRGNLTIRKISQAGIVTTLAGTAGQAGSSDGTGYAAQFVDPAAVAVDSGGNLYVVDSRNCTIRKITPAGVVTTLAGKAGKWGWADGTGSSAEFYFPAGVTVDGQGNVYIADAGNCKIRKITPGGVVTTLAGDGWRGWRDGAGGEARFNSPLGLAVDGAGTLYVADSGNFVIRKITAAGAVTTLAGAVGLPGSTDGAGSEARFGGGGHVSLDSAGNVYVTDELNHTIRKVTPGGVVTTVAGTAGLSDTTNGTGTSALFYRPSGVAVDRAGIIYVGDSGNNQIRKITTEGVVTTFAGAPSLYGVDGPGDAVQFKGLNDVAVDSAGNFYVTDNHTIRKISPAGAVTTLAGKSGLTGSADGAGSSARFNFPSKLAVDGTGNVFVADNFSKSIRKITPAGVVTTFAVHNVHGLATDASGNLYVTDRNNNLVQKITPAGVVTTIVAGPDSSNFPAKPLTSPEDVVVDTMGNLYVADHVKTISKITPAGIVSTLAGKPSYHTHLDPPVESVDGLGGDARFTDPVGLTVDSAGNVYLSDINTIRRITPAGVVTTLAGVAGQSGSANGTGSNARFNRAGGLAVDAQGNVYIADAGNGLLRKMTPAGVVTTFAGTIGSKGSADGIGSAARFSGPSGMAADGSNNIFIADTYNNTIRKISNDGVVTTLAGKAGSVGSTDGALGVAKFNSPVGLAVDGAGNLYTTDTGNHTIRKITTSGTVTTLAGQAGIPGAADGPGGKAQFSLPHGVAVDATSNVYVADTDNNSIRKITPAGEVTTLAGPVPGPESGMPNSIMGDGVTLQAASVGGPIGSADGMGGAARFNQPTGLVVDETGNVYVADTNNHTIRKISPTGLVTTLAGLAGASGWVDGAGSDARFRYPVGLSLDTSGNIYIADCGNYTIRKVTAAGVVTSLSGLAGSTGWINGTGLAARFEGTEGVTVDRSGNVYVSCSSTDSNNILKGQLAGPPTITSQTVSVTAQPGNSVELMVKATGVPAPSYQWYFNGAIINGATSSTLQLTNVRTADAGDYTVVVTNEFGSVTSQKASLAIAAPPPLVTTSRGRGGGGGISLPGLAALAMIVLLRRWLTR